MHSVVQQPYYTVARRAYTKGHEKRKQTLGKGSTGKFTGGGRLLIMKLLVY